VQAFCMPWLGLGTIFVNDSTLSQQMGSCRSKWVFHEPPPTSAAADAV